MPDIQQADVVGNYLQNYYGAKDRVQAQQDADFQRQRQVVQDDRASKQFDQTSQINALALAKQKHDNLVGILGRATDEGSFQNGLRQAALPVEQGGLGLPPEQISHLTFAKDYKRLQEESGALAEHLGILAKQSGLETDRAHRGLIAAQTEGARAQADFVKSGKGQFGKPLPTGLQNKETELLNDVQIASNNNADVTMYQGKIKTGELDPGLLYNNYNRAKSFFGVVDPADKNTIAYSNFLSDMKRLQNESLRLNKGVQTEGDAQRAWQELFDNINDKNIVASRLDRIAKLNARAASQKAGLVRNQRRSFFGSGYQEPNWEELGVDPTLVAPPNAAKPAGAAATGKTDTSAWKTTRVK